MPAISVIDAKKRWSARAMGAFGLLALGLEGATNTITQTVTYNVPSVSTFTVSNDVTFATFATPTAGQNFTSVIDTSSTYNVSNNGGQDSKKVVGRLVSSIPTGLTLKATLTAPTGAAGISNVLMTTADQSLVTGIDNGAFASNQIKYELTADVTTAQTGSGQTLNVILTLVSGS